MTLFDGLKLPPMEIKERIWWHNIHRLRMWSTVGSHVENGIMSILGARQGTYMTNCTDWDHIQVRDFEMLGEIWKEKAEHFSKDSEACIAEIQRLGDEIKLNLGLDWVWLEPDASRYTMDLYDEALNLGQTYYSKKYV